MIVGLITCGLESSAGTTFLITCGLESSAGTTFLITCGLESSAGTTLSPKGSSLERYSASRNLTWNQPHPGDDV